MKIVMTKRKTCLTLFLAGAAIGPVIHTARAEDASFNTGSGSTGGRRIMGKPLLPDFHADPSAREFDGKYYLYCTHDLATNDEWHSEDIHAFSSRDLVEWNDEGAIFTKKYVAWADVFLWAPDCIERNGKYYLYYGAFEGGPITVGVAVSDSPAGPFKDPLGHPLIAAAKIPAGVPWIPTFSSMTMARPISTSEEENISRPSK